MSSIGKLLFLLTVLIAVALCSSADAAHNYSTQFNHGLYPPKPWFSGQEIRLHLQVRPNRTTELNVYVNHSGGLRVRIVAAYPGRAQSGVLAPCQAISSYGDGMIWHETQDLSIKKVTQYPQLVLDTYMSFVVPPFPWRICVRSVRNGEQVFLPRVWRDVNDPPRRPNVYGSNASQLFWYGSSHAAAGDFAAIAVFARDGFPYKQNIPVSAFPNKGDAVKLVPSGYPCSYERANSSRDGTTTVDFCGTNNVLPTGEWRHDRCRQEGAPDLGVGVLGSQYRNPLVQPYTAAETVYYPTVLTAYFQLPAEGSYDVCYSPLDYRQTIKNLNEAVASPLWFKVTSNSTAPSRANSNYDRTRESQMKIHAKGVGVPSWSLSDEPRGGSYGVIRLSAPSSTYLARALSTVRATRYDHGTNASRRFYFETGSGDILRLVPSTTNFDASGTATSSELSSVTSVTQTNYGGGEAPFGGRTFYQRKNGNPGLGTSTNIGCWDGGADVEGSTLFTDLGGDPHRAMDAHNLDEDDQTSAHAYLQFPSTNAIKFVLCYKQKGNENWRQLQWNDDYTVGKGEEADQLRSALSVYYGNYTWKTNDTRALTLAELTIRDGFLDPKLDTIGSNFFTEGLADADTTGSMVKLIRYGTSCHTSTPLAMSLDPGQAECALTGVCGTTFPCTDCGGSKDESSTLVHSIVFHVVLPNTTTTAIQVCFRRKAGNWDIIRRSPTTWGHPDYFYATPVPTIHYHISDLRANSWARLVLARPDDAPIDLRPHDGYHGSLVRIVPEGATCDITWQTSTDDNAWDPEKAITDFGVHCRQTSDSGLCTGRNLRAYSGGVNGSAPYIMDDPEADDKIEDSTLKAVGFVKLPAAGRYQVCYRGGHMGMSQYEGKNWFPFPKLLVVEEASGVSLDTSTTGSTFVAGSYSSLVITSSGDAIDLETAAVKLVNTTSATCDDPAAGTQSLGGMYVSFTKATNRGGRLTDSSNYSLSSGTAASVRAWITMPNFLTETTQDYKVCFRKDMHVHTNWEGLGNVTVQSYGIEYSATVAPFLHGVFPVKLLAVGSTTMNILPGQDAIKVVAATDPCAGSLTPSGVTSYTTGKEMAARGLSSDSALTEGITDVDPDYDLSSTTSATFTTTLNGTVEYRICYKLASVGVWMEIPQTETSLRTYDLGDPAVTAGDSGVDTITLSSSLLGQLPASGYHYHGYQYASSLPTGVATSYDTASTGGSSSTTYYLTVSGTDLSTSDTLRVVRINTETSPAEWNTYVADACNAPNVEVEQNPTSDSTTSSSVFSFNLPLTPGRVIFCYQLSGSSVWIQPEPATWGYNPVMLLDTGFYARVTASAIEFVDSVRLMGAAHGSLVPTDDYFYVANASGGTCGVADSMDGTTPVSSAINALSYSGTHTSGTYYQKLDVSSGSTLRTTVTDTRGVYQVCYFKSAMGATMQADGVIPFTQSGLWYQARVYLTETYKLGHTWTTYGTATSLEATCPSGTNITANVPFRVSLALLDSNSDVVASADSIPEQITASTSTNSWEMRNSDGKCRWSLAPTYGVAASNPTVSTLTGRGYFDMRALSRCGSSSSDTCGVTFKSGSLTSNECTFTLLSTTATEFVNTEGPTECRVGQECTVSFTLKRSDKSIAYSKTGSSTATLSTHSGMSYLLNSASTSGGSSTQTLTNGVLSLTVKPRVSSGSAWLATSTSYTVSISVTYSSFTATHSFTVKRPSLSQLRLKELIMVDWDGSETLNDNVTNKFPKFEASGSYGSTGGFWNPGATYNSLSSVPHFPLVAGQWYKLTVEALDSFGTPLPSTSLISSSSKLNLEFAHHDNMIIGPASSQSEAYSYSLSHTGVSFSTVEQSIVFRIRNATGCSNKTVGCRINITVGGAALDTPSFLQVPVVNHASKLTAVCKLPFETTWFAACPPSKIEQGAIVKIAAVDPWGEVDPFFRGVLYARTILYDMPLHGPPEPTTVAMLKGRNATWPLMEAREGIFNMSDFSLPKPCDHCRIMFYSDWNVDPVILNVSFVPSSTKLVAELALERRDYFLLSSDRALVSSKVTPSASYTNDDIALHSDTDLCYNVYAVNTDKDATLYDTLLVSYTVTAAGVQTVTAAASQGYPSNQANLQHGAITFCIRVSGSAGASFTVKFQVEGVDAGHWGATSAGTAITGAFTLRKKLVGGLRINALTGLTPISTYTAPANKVWGYKKTATNATTSVFVSLSALDHYGNPISRDDLHTEHSAFYVGIGGCTETELLNGNCGTGTGQNSVRSIYLNTPHSISDAGMLRVALTTSSHLISRGTVSYTLAVTQWCLSCDIPFYVYKVSSLYTDTYSLTQISATLRVSILMPDDATRYVAMPTGKSPYKPSASYADQAAFASTYWRQHQPTYSDNPTGRSSPILYHSTCALGTDTGCLPQEAYFLDSLSNSDSPAVISGAGGSHLEYFVITATEAPKFGEASCTSNCISAPDQLFSQVDIFNSYTFSLAIGNQRLRCVPASACIGDQTTTVKVTIEALGTTIESALLAMDARASTSSKFNIAKFKLVGMDASDYYAVTPTTGALVSGGPSVYGALTVSGSINLGSGSLLTSSVSVTSLTTTSGNNSDAGTYYFAWRGKPLVHEVSLMVPTSDAGLVRAGNIPVFVAADNAQYNGYAAFGSLQDAAFNYSEAVVPINYPVPFTVDALDVDSRRVPVNGTVSVALNGWQGCGNGGTVSASGTTMIHGRATVNVQFSAPCQRCFLSFFVTPDTADSTEAFAPLTGNDLYRRVVSRAVEVRDYLSGSATVVAAITDYTVQSSAITIDDTVSLELRAYSAMGTLAILDPSAKFTAYAYAEASTDNDISPEDQGGILRSSASMVNSGSRHNVAVSTTNGNATLTFAFQRTCRACRVVVYWSIVGSGSSGHFVVRNSDGTTFAVSAPIVKPFLVGLPNGVFQRSTNYPYAVTNGYASSNIPFAGYLGSMPAVTPASIVVVDGTGGNGGYFSTLAEARPSMKRSGHGFNVTVHIVNTTTSCYHCRILFPGLLSFDVVVRTVATHYRIEHLSKTRVALGEELALKAYASDDRGSIDWTVGGLSRCQFVRPFMCGLEAVRGLTIKATMDGKDEDSFYPKQFTIHTGGPSVEGFSISSVAGSPFYVRNGETPGEIKFVVTGKPVVFCEPLIEDGTGLSSADYPAAQRFSVDWSNEYSNLYLSTDSGGDSATVFEPFEILFAFVNRTTNATFYPAYIDTRGDNTLVLHFSGDCPVVLLTPYYVTMVEGVARARVRFTRQNYAACYIKATSLTGSIPCLGGSRCWTTAEVYATPTRASEWKFTRPSLADNNGPVGPKSAVPDRLQIVGAQLYEWLSGGRVEEAQWCSSGGCFLVVRARDTCTPQPTIIPSGGAKFNEYGQAAVSVTWKTKYSTTTEGGVEPYSCELLTSVIGASVDGPADTAYLVDVCYPSEVAFIGTGTKETDVMHGLVTTGRSYVFELQSLNSTGAVCFGDTQLGTSTLVTVSLVNANDNTAVTDVDVINLNMTQSKFGTAGNQRGWSNTSYLAAGAFKFQLVFTAATAPANPVKVKFVAISPAPAFTSILYSSPVAISIAPARLRFSSLLPKFISRYVTYEFEVQLADAVPENYYIDTNTAPNIIAQSGVRIELDFFPFYRTVPLEFVEGTAMTQLTDGRIRFAIRFTGPDGTYRFSFRAPNSELVPTLVQTVTLQTPYALSLHTVTYRSGAPNLCSAGCTLPKPAFQHNSGTPDYLNTTSAERFLLSLMVTDVNNKIVVAGLENANVTCTMVKTAAVTNATVALSPALVTQLPATQHLAGGGANFSLGFSGSTRPRPGAPHEKVKIACALFTGNSTLDDQILKVSTLDVAVEHFNITDEMKYQLDDSPVLRIRTDYKPSMGEMNLTHFHTIMRERLNAVGIDYITKENQAKALQVTACQVDSDRFGTADLRHSVCGTEHVCTSRNNNSCPPQVIRCSCPDDPDGGPQYSRRRSWRRRMEEMQAGFYSIRMQLEVHVVLRECPGFKMSDLAAIRDEHGKIEDTLINSFKAGDFDSFAVEKDWIVASTWLAPHTTAHPTTDEPSYIQETEAPANVTSGAAPATGVSSSLVNLPIVLALLLCVLSFVARKGEY